jgi:hypothetical protein
MITRYAHAIPHGENGNTLCPRILALIESHHALIYTPRVFLTSERHDGK